MKLSLQSLNFQEGSFLLIQKPLGWTSFGVIAQLKKWTKSKIGHAGTLDPLAEGLMICCTGKFTKKLNEYIGLDKKYKGIIRIGATTPTYDLESEPENFTDYEHITKEKIEEIKHAFRGKILQIPPIHSALKVEGKPMYAIARKGEEVILKSREVNIFSFEWEKIDFPELHFNIHCSSGTYIRSIAYDIGAALGVGAFLQSLQRTHIGEYSIEDAYTIDEMSTIFGEKINARMIYPKVKF